MYTITVKKREEKAKAKQLRKSGVVPCCVYGGAITESLSIQMDQQTTNKLFRQKREGSKIQLKLDDQMIPVQIKDKTRNIISNEIEHVSFQVLEAEQKVNSVAHIILKNTDKIAGILEKILLEIPYIALPKDMIDTVTVDLDDMPVGSTLTVGDIKEFNNKNIELQVDINSAILKISDKKLLTSQENSPTAQ